jgi:hypothetical protein
MGRLAICCGGLLLTAQALAHGPPLWGYGVKGCDDYARMWLGMRAGEQGAIGEYRRYQDWLSGFVSGLNIATGSDVLAGADIEGALRRIYRYCDEHRKADVYAAVRVLVRQLSTVE